VCALASLILRLLRDDEGQDVVEYALLASTIGLSAALSIQLLLSVLGLAYRGWVSNINGLWEPPAPGG
jgi:Flp pilus assembly pilin Flp